MAPAPQFKLSKTLSGHSSDVRAVCAPIDSLILSASRDGTVRSWKLSSAPAVNPLFANASASQPQSVAVSAFSAHKGYVNSLAYHPDGLVISGGQDKLIYAHWPGDTEPSHILVGHEQNVNPYLEALRKGSWDNTARVWKNWECVYTLKGHERSVWGVLSLGDDEYLTASADKTIRLWHGDKQVRVFQRHTDVVRALCEIPGLGFASAGNDAVIYVWTRDGDLLLELHGHTNFIYSLAVLPSGEIVSSGEDRSVKIWNHGECIQTITLPAISIWSVAVQPNGDIVCGSSDSEVRIFTRDKARFASEEDIQEFDAKVSSSAIPQQSLGDINKEKLPGPEALQRKGKKDGQVIMVKNDASVEAHQWSSATQSWTKIGDVVNAVSQSQKQTLDGIEYDYVFDVDIQEGAPPLKLPYNVTQNPFEAAQKFLEKNGLDMGYIDQVVKFIEQNTGGVKLGMSSGAVDPYSTGRYMPGAPSTSQAPAFSSDPYSSSSSSSKPTTTSTRKHLPQTIYATFKAAEMQTILRKIKAFNSEVPPEMAISEEIFEKLSTLTTPATINSQLPVLTSIVLKWPSAKRFPVLDLIRVVTSRAPAVVACYNPGDQSILEILFESAELQEGTMLGRKELETNALLVLRILANLFEAEEGRSLLVSQYDNILEAAKLAYRRGSGKNLKVAFNSLCINYAVLLHKKGDSDNAIALIEPLLKSIQDTGADAEAVFRGLVALGTALSMKRDEIKISAIQVFEVPAALQVVKKTWAKENRIKEVIAEIEALLK